MSIKKPEVQIAVWTERFLGTKAYAESFLKLIDSVDGGRWRPERANSCEPIRRHYSDESKPVLIEEWTWQRGQDGWVANTILFKRRAPNFIAMVDVRRGKSTPALNRIHLWLDAREFDSQHGPERIISIVQALVTWSDAAYASAWRTGQSHHRSAPGTPMERLDQLDWLTFFGEPYLKMLGQAVVKEAGFSEVRELGSGVIALATARPDSVELTESPDLLLSLEKRLGEDVFADEHGSENVRRTPHFDLRETVMSNAVEGSEGVRTN